ncbi:hypothetical protein [Zobellia galactanivorans]|uniref:hypothetical protein n=1 Tax=Zobellia galactanivorans (strain DSM 12802 / CCUG 47099 / CIP 106680 / NCIMB 13871 / Dsij) TaxID=63186 RepID=UPI001C06D859|nr:hypothetical protein [Zobellia galactanivorans]MBU3027478.1 hypothetical protein [Zobellia galactanivorans]
MRPNTYIRSSLFLLLIAFCSCSSSDDGAKDPTPQESLPPEASVLVFPKKDEECNQGDIISATQSKLTFKWKASDHTDSYTLVLKNLETNETSENDTSTNSLALTILRNTPYSWNIISKSDETATTATSETWKFYNAGEGNENYAPFPAEAVAPTMGASVSQPLTLSWKGSDVDNDIASYDIYLGTDNPPTTLHASTSDSEIDDIALNPATVYYWRVVTTDENGSSSQSPVFEFKTK